MAYRSTSSSGVVGSNGSGVIGSAAGFSLPALTSRTTAAGAGNPSGAAASSNGATSSLLSAFSNNAASTTSPTATQQQQQQQRTASTMATGPVGGGGGLGGNSNQAQAAFMNAGPNRTVSNVGAQAAQGGMPSSSLVGPSQQAAGAGLGGFGSPLGAPTTPGLSDLNLDPSDFPALGSGSSGAAALHSLSQNSGNTLLSSYATQVGAGTTSIAGAANNNQQPFFGNSGLQQQQQQREFSADDFPALGAPGDLGSGLNGFASSNGLGGGPQTQAQARANQEQASAAAALAHRQNLLGSMSSNNNGLPTPQQQQQPGGIGRPPSSTAFSEDALQQQQQKRNFAQKMVPTSLSPYPAGAPLPPQTSSNLQSPSSQHQSNGLPPPPGQSPLPPPQPHQSLSSLPPQLTNLLLQQQQQQQRPVGGGSGALLPATPGTTTTTAPGGPTQLPQTPAQQVLYSPADRFGLAGLLHIIKMSADPDFAIISLGSDLEKLGLDLASSNNLHSTFITPWAEPDQLANLHIEPEYTLPSCYNVQPPPAMTKIASFSDETLFLIFYSQPRDAMQEAAAEQLYKRNWRYHKDLHLWLTKDAGSEPTQKTSTYERGSYIFFDPNAWEKVQKEFVLVFEHLETRHRTQTGQQQQQQLPSAVQSAPSA